VQLDTTRRHGEQSAGDIEGGTPLAWHALAFSTLLADAVGDWIISARRAGA